jgi:surface antigen
MTTLTLTSSRRSILPKVVGALLGPVAVGAAALLIAPQAGAAQVIPPAPGATYGANLTLGDPSVYERSGPSSSDSVVGSLPFHSSINIACQTTGSDVNGSSIWDQLSGGQYVSDYFVNTPNVNDWSPPIPQCSAPPTPSQGTVPPAPSQGATPPPPPPATTNLYLTLGDPSVHERSGPSSSDSVVGSLPFHSSISIACQTTGSDINGSDIWDRLSGGQYVSDYFVNTPNVNAWSPPLTQCPGPQPPSQGTVPPPAPHGAMGRTTNHNEGQYGECTMWAIEEFHLFTGVYPDFTSRYNNGNAMYWATNAALDGWTVTSSPTANAIAVFPPGANGAFSVGHVAWVTAVANGKITISEMNGTAGWNRVDTRGPFVPDSRVRFIVAP